jgi:surface protein
MEIDAITRSKLKNVVFTSTEPPSTNVLWAKPNGNEVTMYIFKNGSWQALKGGEIDSTVYAYIDTQDAATLASAKEYADSSLATEITKVNETETTIQNNVSTNATDISTLKGYFEDGVANKAKQLATTVTLWGNKFDGTTSIEGSSNKNGDLINIGNEGNSNFCIVGVAANVDYTHLYITQGHRPIAMQVGYGNVGIGTATPSNKLEVLGTFKATGNTTIGGNLTVAGSITAESSPWTTTTYVNTELAKKQDTLVSGTNIKTINKQSILGEGDITIESTGSSDIPKMWVNVLSTKDTAFKIDGEIVEIPAYRNMILKDFSSIEPYVDESAGIANTCDGLVRFDIHYNNINVPITKFTFETYIYINGWIMTYAKLLKHLDVSGFDTSNMTSMKNMYASMQYLTELDVSGFDTSKVTSFAYTFSGCDQVVTLEVSGWNTSSATDMSGMFCNCSHGLTTLNTSKWNTSKVTTMNRMFLNDSLLTTLDVSGWDVSNVTDFDYMFLNCEKLTTLDLSNWNPKSAKKMGATFCNCPFTSLDVSNFDLTNLNDMTSIFGNCTSLTDIKFGEGWGKTLKAIILDLSNCGSSKSYKLSDNTYATMLTMYDRAANGLTTTYTIMFSTKHNIPDGWTDKMTAKGYTITLS